MKIFYWKSKGATPNHDGKDLWLYEDEYPLFVDNYHSPVEYAPKPLDKSSGREVKLVIGPIVMITWRNK